jgi:hypothetical protein
VRPQGRGDVLVNAFVEEEFERLLISGCDQCLNPRRKARPQLGLNIFGVAHCAFNLVPMVVKVGQRRVYLGKG